MIELKGLNKSYGKYIALQHINLKIARGEIFGIIGKSGAGKSTLLRCINRLEAPDSGNIYVDKQDITHLKGNALQKARYKMGMIFQHFNLLSNKTVFDNIALPMRIQGYKKEDINERIEDLLNLVELKDKIHAYPSALSGGQKQRVAIARALSTSPDILLCDEATSALDPATTDAILALLKKINEKLRLTIVLITHEMNVVKQICHRLALMADGQVIEQAKLSDLIADKNSIARKMLYAQLSPKIPSCLQEKISKYENEKPLVKINFEGQGATVPFISQTSRELKLDINILLANVDRFETITCGVLIAELSASNNQLNQFIARCKAHHLSVEILGYVNENGF